MSSSNGESSDTDSDDGFNEDMEALKRACQLTGEKPHSSTTAAGGIASEGASSEGESEGEGDEDLQLVRSIQKRFAVPMDMEGEPLKMKPLCTVMPDWSDSDDIEDDYETLRAIQRRFAAYNDDAGSLKDNFEEFLHRPEQVGATIIDSEKETSNSFVERTNAREGFLNCVDTSEPTGKNVETCDHAGGSSDIVEWNGSGADDGAQLPLKTSHFPNSALAFVDAIKKNRLCQKLIRSKMMQMEARMEELGNLIERVRMLKDFQVLCKKRTGRALSQKKDPRVQLISVPKLRANMKPNEKNIPASYKGPPENVHVPNYKEALATFSIPFNKEKWSKEERENLMKGVKQQFQEMLLQQSVLSEADGSYDSSNVDSIMKSIKDYSITPERLRSFLPKVNWEHLATMYVRGRTGAECQARFLNSEDPLISNADWTPVEDKNILHIIQEKGLSNWIDIAVSLGTNRTPFQCLSRYQRSLNASILKREWTGEDDNQLRAAVETYGESNWQVVASTMKGRTGTQCSNRWIKTLHPTRARSGKWSPEEDKRLKVAATLFGPKSWKKIANCVPGRTHVQCRERWVNCLDPFLNKAEWTEEEDLKLEEAIAKHGYCWSKVAACVPHRTDNQCWRRWKMLFPTHVPLLQTARKIQKAALISNFVDRESERPALGPNDFRLPDTLSITGSENVDPSTRKKKRSRRRVARQHNEKDALSGETDSEELPRFTDGNTLETQGRSLHKKGTRRSSRLRKSKAGPSSDNHLSGGPDTRPLDVSDGEEIRGSRFNDGNSMRKSRSLKKRSGINAATTSVPVIGDEACSKEYEPSDPKEEPTPAHLNSQEIPLDAELDGENIIIIQSAKASKLHPRRRNTQTLKEVQRTQSKAPRQAATKRQMKKDKKLTDATNDHLSPLSDSTRLMDVKRATEAGFGISAMKGKNTEGNKSALLPGSSCLPVAPSQYFRSDSDNAVSANLEQPVNSDRNTDVQLQENTAALKETEEDSTTLASFLEQPRADTTNPSSTNLRRKRKKSSQVHTGSNNAAAPILYTCKRQKTGGRTCSKQMLVGEGSRNDAQAFQNQAWEVEVGDDVTLAQFLQQIRGKNRKIDGPKVPPPL